MDKILIRNLHIQGILGVNESERETKREIIINLEVFTDSHKAGISDSLDDCVDYSSLAKEITSLVEHAQRYTVEALAEDIARLCLEHEDVLKITVRVEKPGAIRNADSVGIKITRRNQI
jgi:FolB domain-containing protein